MSRQNKRIYHFTLVELVVSMGIMMAVTGIIAMASWTFYEGHGRAARATAKLKENMAIDKIMDTHVRNMIPFQWVDENNNTRFVFSGEANRLHFTTLRRAYDRRPGALLFIRLFVDEGKLVAEYSQFPRLPWKLEEDENMTYEREVIAEKVASVTFTYAEKVDEEKDEDGSGIEWLEYWAEEEHAALPLAVRMKVVWEDGTVEYWLRRVAGIAKDSTFGVRKVHDENTTRFSNALEGGATGGGENQQ